jgi:hypothetical protein
MGRLRAAMPPATRPATAPEPGNEGGVAWVALSHEAPWRLYPRTDSDRSGRSAPFSKESASELTNRSPSPLASSSWPTNHEPRCALRSATPTCAVRLADASVDQTEARDAHATGIVWVRPPVCRAGPERPPAHGVLGTAAGRLDTSGAAPGFVARPAPGWDFRRPKAAVMLIGFPAGRRAPGPERLPAHPGPASA